jgi:hypothetical protein
MNDPDSPRQFSSSTPRPRADAGPMLRWIMWSVFAWGCLLAVGATLHGVDAETGAVTWSPQPLRGLIVFGCVAVLLVGWNLLLRRRARRR